MTQSHHSNYSQQFEGEPVYYIPTTPPSPDMTQSHHSNYSQQFEGEWDKDIPATDFPDKIAGWF
jgi:hypothetical protein